MWIDPWAVGGSLRTFGSGASDAKIEARRLGAFAADYARVAVTGYPERGGRGGTAYVEVSVASIGSAPVKVRFDDTNARRFCARIFAELARASKRADE